MTMKEAMEAELQEMIRTLDKANGALARIFNVEEGEDDSISWGELAELTHTTQVERFGWCICEDTNGEGQLHDDCPIREGDI